MKSRITRRDFMKDVLRKGAGFAVASRVAPSLSEVGEGINPSPTARKSDSPHGNLKEAMFYKQLDGVMIQCMLEPRQCTVNNWERGYCGTKENRDGKYYTLVYSRPCAVYVEPIEREHFYHVHPGERFLGIGTAGCNLECKFCETWYISQVRPEETTVQNLSPEDVVQLAVSKGCRMVGFTYNEPVVCYEYTLETAKAAKQAGLTTLCHTAGYIYTEPLRTLLAYMDAVNVDLKGFTDKYYLEMCGAEGEYKGGRTRGSPLRQVLDTLTTIKQENVMLEITNPIVPGRNDTRQDIANMTVWIKENLGTDVPLHFSRFFPNYQLTNLPATPVETLDMAYDIARSNGLKFVYVGNVPGHEYESTYCPKCKAEVIHRDSSRDTACRVSLKLDKTGSCRKCGQTIPGIWT
jgi:pyruvate formate lyase activating enzyme